MKKLMAVLLALVTVLCLVACGEGGSGADDHHFANAGTSAVGSTSAEGDITTTTIHDHSSHTTTVNIAGGSESSTEGGIDSPTSSVGDPVQGDADTTTTTQPGSTTSVITTTTKKGESTTTSKGGTTTKTTTTTTTTKKNTTTTTKKTTTTTTKKTTSSSRVVTTTINATTTKKHSFSAAAYSKVDVNVHKVTGKCSVCGTSTSQTEIHTWGAWKYDTYPTSTTEGVKYRVCSGCGEEQVTYVPATSANTANYPQEMLALVNAERAKQGLPAYKYYTAGQAGANTRAKELMEYFSHTRPDGSKWWTVASFDKSVCQAGAENIARGYGSPEDVMAAFMASSSHRANILSTQYTHIVVAYYEGAWVQIFTKPW